MIRIATAYFVVLIIGLAAAYKFGQATAYPKAEQTPVEHKVWHPKESGR